MAEWRYQIQHIELKPAKKSDAELEKILEEQGEQGWELVQVLHDPPGNPDYRLIFKAQKPVAMD
jgi:Domain of unknown function (DUF4177)